MNDIEHVGNLWIFSAFITLNNFKLLCNTVHLSEHTGHFIQFSVRKQNLVQTKTFLTLVFIRPPGICNNFRKLKVAE